MARLATREHVIDAERREGAPLITIFGGKLTAYRIVAEEVLARVGGFLGERGKNWTARAPLPGGDIPGGDLEKFIADLREKKPFLDAFSARRFARAYGTLCLRFLEGAEDFGDLGEHFGAGLTSAEADYLVAREWAHTGEDILWRRSKLGLRGAEISLPRLEAWLAEKSAAAPKKDWPEFSR